jgi:prepilin-type N-terminal cleavage/methylation domain-containing protein
MITRNQRGFTLIEIVVVLVLISIIAATVFTRSITTDQINFGAQTEKIKSHIRYAQSMAMKRNQAWGIRCIGNAYWLFGPGASPLIAITPIQMPGQNAAVISLSDQGLDIPSSFILYFDGHGRPYQLATGPLVADLPITIEDLPDRSLSRNIFITAETGLITTP